MTCHTCENRTSDLIPQPDSPPKELYVTIFILPFKAPFEKDAFLQKAIQATLHGIINSARCPSHPDTFTSWSPVLDSLSEALILTTAIEPNIDEESLSSIFAPVHEFLADKVAIRHLYLPPSVVNLGAKSPTTRLPLTLLLLHAPTTPLECAIGKTFGWEPSRHLLSTTLSKQAPLFATPGNLVRDFRGWVESSKGNEALVMMFQWSSTAAGEKFCDPVRRSHGPNGVVVASDFWDVHVGKPVRHLEADGASVKSYRVELRAAEMHEDEIVGNNIGNKKVARRLSLMATELGEKMKNGLWKRE
ncbi:hypothetical protein GQ43DRAFT_310948 [Delitschia confertaspora ATCC 74209]|uniref:Uncharacterized protein n=1 Tax=Delitschia confertaspora ATCC 74209 TaxID=1513339 RepID=A0A9P4N018_9PLEO|nr:hypothetical protein GQ43DRAFT_310948 [Delitschia confertaspora ATCC 74209]